MKSREEEKRSALTAADYPDRLVHRHDPLWREALWQAQNRGVHLLNTTVVPSGADGVWLVKEVTHDFARDLLACADTMQNEGSGFGYRSHVGHDAAAEAMTALFGVRIPVNRDVWDGLGIGLALQLKGRIPEGSILTREQMETIGYAWRILICDTDAALPALPMKTLTEYIILLSRRVSAQGPPQPSDEEVALYRKLAKIVV